jgi:DNA polymerase-3 subunit beta
MKFTVHRDQLRKALVSVSYAINAKSVMPVLSNVLITARDANTITLAATNLEVGITCHVPATVERMGEITIPSKLSVDLINNLPSEPVHFEVDAHAISIKCNRFDNTLMGMSALEYPDLPKFSGAALQLPRSFIDAIAHVITAAAIDDSRPVLTAVRTLISADNIELVCADGFRLAQTKISLPLGDAAPEPMELLIPAKTMADVLRIMNNVNDESIGMYVSDNKSQVAFVSGQFEIVSRLIEGKFPDVARVIPNEFQSEFVFQVNDLQRAAKIASLINTTAGVKIMLNDTNMAVISNGNAVGTAHAIVDGQHTGITHEISLNVKYLQDALAALENAGAKEVIFKSNSNTAPAILQPVQNRNYKYVVMPIMVR